MPGAKPISIAKGTASQPIRGPLLVEQGSPLQNNGAALSPPLWHKGAREQDQSLPTVLLCAHVSGHQLFGGERSFLDVLTALSLIPLNVVVTLPSGNNKRYLDDINGLCIGTYVFPYPQWIDNRDSYGWLSNKFADIIARHGVDIVHSNTIMLYEPLMAARRMGRQTLIHSRELISLDEQLCERIGLRTSEIVGEILKRADWIVGNSRATCGLFSKGDHTLYIPNAVSLSEFDMNNKFGHIIKFGIVSSNIPKKGVADFVEVARRAATCAPRAHFVVVGPHNAQTKVWSAQIARGDRPGNLTFLGYSESPRKAMSELNVLLNLSHFAESFGRTLAEGLAARRPVIAYDWGALREVMPHGKAGYLVPYRDIDGVVDAVIRLCNNPDLIRKMGEAGRAFIASHFSQENLRNAVANSYERIFNRSALDQQASETTRPLPYVPASARVGQASTTTIVIPVYNASAEVRDCINSVLRHTDLQQDRIVVIDDGSPDPAVSTVLDSFKAIDGLTIHRNIHNIGYTKTVNSGIIHGATDDVVLLNSDTIVTPKWLHGLRSAAYSRPKVATVTAMSDNAGAFSFPTFNEACYKPDFLSHDEYALLLTQSTQHCTPPEVPTGSGFCMFIRRAFIDEHGLFDHEGFPRGYGEENDFCMRAYKNGWLNLISPWSFVYHVRSASFKDERAALVKKGVDVVTKRYPDYAALVKEAFNRTEMVALRNAAQRVLETR